VQEVLAGAMQQEVRELRAQRRGKTAGSKA
jgi:GntR family transcriptional regulator, transcriptional repressor for pyruvate dehydrogenase complex